MKRIVSLMLVCVLSLTIIPQSNAVTQRELNEENATMYNTEMITYFEQEVGYPDHYGGAWLNQNSGHLVIGLTERNEEIEQYYYDVTGADVLEFETVEYSLQELHDAILDTRDTLQVMSNAPKMVGNAIIQHTNSVEVYVDEMSTSTYIRNRDAGMLPEFDFVNEIEHSEIVEFKILSDFRLDSETMKPGTPFKKSQYSDNVLGSMGYIAYRTNSNGETETGFVTAGHCFTTSANYGEAYVMNGTKIGQWTYAVGPAYYDDWEIGDDVRMLGPNDFAFVKVNNNCTLNPAIVNDSPYTQNLNMYYSMPAENSTIYKSGHSTGMTYGLVRSIYYDTDPNDLGDGPVVKRIAALYTSLQGDSGAIVYKRGSNNYAYVVGIHQGAATIGNTYYALSIPAYYIHNCTTRDINNQLPNIRAGTP